MYTDKYKGIYAYKDNKTNKIVYIGKDSHLYKKARHIQHYSESRKDHQKINNILQSNPKRYSYIEIIQLPSKTTIEELDGFEIRYINLFNPKFNFTIGGDGAPTNKGKTFTREHRIKISKAHKGKVLSQKTKDKVSKNNARYNLGKHLSEETKKKISEATQNKEVNNETKLKLSKIHNTTGYFRVHKLKDKRTKQGFIWVYKWRENGQQKKLSSVNLITLASKVKTKGLPWFKLH